MTIESAQWRMADRLTGGNLESIIAGHRQVGRSYEEIARRVYAEYGVEASRQTVARWAVELGIDQDEPTTEAAATV